MKYKVLCLALSLSIITPMIPNINVDVIAHSKSATFKVSATKPSIIVSDNATFKLTNSQKGKDIKVKIYQQEVKQKDIVVKDNSDGTYDITLKNLQTYADPEVEDTSIKFYVVEKKAQIEPSTEFVEVNQKITKIPVTLDSVSAENKKIPYGQETDRNVQITHPVAKSYIMRIPFRVLDKFPNVGEKVSTGYLQLAEEYTPGVTGVKSFKPWFYFDRSQIDEFTIVKAKLSDLGFTNNQISNAELSVKLDGSSNSIDISRYLPTLKDSQTYGTLGLSNVKANGINANIQTQGTTITFTATESTSALPTITGNIISTNVVDIPFSIKINATRAQKLKPSVSVKEIVLYEGQRIKDVKIDYTAEDRDRNEVEGKLRITEKEDTELRVGSHKVKWEFIPNDTSKYEKVTGEVTVTVKDAKLELDKSPEIELDKLVINKSLENIKFKDKGKFKIISQDGEVSDRDIEIEWKYPRDTTKFDEKVPIIVKYKDKENEFDINFFSKKSGIKNFLINTDKGDIKVSLSTSDIEPKGNTLVVKSSGTKVTYPNGNELIDSGNLEIDYTGKIKLLDKATFKPKDGEKVTLEKDTEISALGEIHKLSSNKKPDSTTSTTTTVTITTTSDTTTESTTEYVEPNPVKIDNSYIPFSDIENSWAKDQITYLHGLGIINGHNGKFNPKSNITRADFCIMLKQYLDYTGTQMTTSNVNFKDIKGNEYYAPTIMSLATANIINGYNDNTFKPKNPINREEAVQLIATMLKHLDSTMSDTLNAPKYKDYKNISKWAKPSFDYVNKKGLISGYNGMFRPKDKISREEVASIIYRIVVSN